MIPGRIHGATRYLGAPAGWEPENGTHCAHLAILDEPVGGMPAMHSVWEPTPDEVARIAAGASIYLCILGHAHPPVSLAVGSAPNTEPTP